MFGKRKRGKGQLWEWSRYNAGGGGEGERKVYSPQRKERDIIAKGREEEEHLQILSKNTEETERERDRQTDEREKRTEVKSNQVNSNQLKIFSPAEEIKGTRTYKK